MKNAILYYYDYAPTKIIQKNRNYKLEYNDKNYILVPYENDLTKLEDAYKFQYELVKDGIPINLIIKNKFNHLFTSINNINYVMLENKYLKEKINIQDIIYFSTIKKQAQNNWYLLWSEKNDYLEYEFSKTIKKYPLIMKTFNYYMGLAENAVQLIRNTKIDNMSLSHQRIKTNSTMFDLYNPLNLIIDSRVRDISEYFKAKFFYVDIEKEFNEFINKNLLTKEEKKQFLARLLYPTYYFDLYEKIIKGKAEEQELEKIIEKTSEYEKLLKKTHQYLNIDEEIEWFHTI